MHVLAQEPADWEVSKVFSIFSEKNQTEQCSTRRHTVGSEGTEARVMDMGHGHVLTHWQEHRCSHLQMRRAAGETTLIQAPVGKELCQETLNPQC